MPAASLAIHVTVVLPIEKREPDDGVQLGPNVTDSLSVAVGSV